MSDIYDQMDSEQWKEDEKHIKRISEEVAKIKPKSKEYRDMQFMIANKDNILRNRALINLLG